MLATALPATLPAQTFTTLADLDAPGQYWFEYTTLVQAWDGNIYGTLEEGGIANSGSVFKITPEGILTTLHSFCTSFGSTCTDGDAPLGGLSLGTDGNLYGTTFGGGAYNAGTVYKLSLDGQLTTLYNFGGGNAGHPYAPVIQATDGNLYGTTYYGGVNTLECDEGGGCGTVFSLTPQGIFKVLHTFCVGGGECSDGSFPAAALVQSPNGGLYGTTPYGGAGKSGTVFKITPNGNFTTIHSFCPDISSPCFGGATPEAGLTMGPDQQLYGTTIAGGAVPDYPYGTIYKISSAGEVTPVYDICSTVPCPDTYAVWLGVTFGSDGNLYGSTTWRNADLLKVTPEGTSTILYTFEGNQSLVNSDLLQATNGKFYGTTMYSANGDSGTLFSLDTGLYPFVAFVRGFGSIGQTVEILGQGFLQVDRVAFDGIPAVFSVQSDTYLTAIVPSTAKSSYVTVTMPDRTLMSNLPFQVIP